jgi:hypothetical protein
MMMYLIPNGNISVGIVWQETSNSAQGGILISTANNFKQKRLTSIISKTTYTSILHNAGGSSPLRQDAHK